MILNHLLIFIKIYGSIHPIQALLEKIIIHSAWNCQHTSCDIQIYERDAHSHYFTDPCPMHKEKYIQSFNPTKISTQMSDTAVATDITSVHSNPISLRTQALTTQFEQRLLVYHCFYNLYKSHASNSLLNRCNGTHASNILNFDILSFHIRINNKLNMKIFTHKIKKK
eukprot:904303_1